MEILVKNSQRSIKIDRFKIESLVKRLMKYLSINPSFSFLKRAELSILFVGDKRMKELNLHFRGKDKTTDVLSFPQERSIHKEPLNFPFMLGDIVINLEQAKRQAEERNTSLYEEVNQLLVHGFLHLLGYDHEKNRYQQRKMKRLEKELLEATR